MGKIYTLKYKKKQNIATNTLFVRSVESVYLNNLYGFLYW